MTRPPGTWPFPGGLDLGRVRAAASAARPARALGASGVAASHAWLASTLMACCCVLILGASAASAQTPQASVTVPPDGSTVGIPGPFDPVTGYFGDEPLQGPYFPMSWSCDAESWELTFTSNTTRIGWPAGSTSSVSQQFSPYWREPLRLRGPRDALPDTGTITGIFKCFGFYDPGGDGIISIPFSTTVTYVEGPEGVTPPPGGGGSGGAPGGPGTPGGPSTPGGPGTPGGGPGGQPSPPATCPEAAGLLAGARFWSGLAQRYRGKSVEAGRAVIDYANKANAAFWTVLGDAASSIPEDKITKEVVEELGRKDRLDGYRQLWQNSLNGKWPEISRQLRILRDLQKYFKALGPIGNFEASLQISEALYYLGLAAQQGVLRASWDALADDALARANERQRLAERACVKTASGTQGALAGAAKRAKRKLYTKLSNARSVRGFRVRPGAGLRRDAALALNKLLAGQERTVALAQVVEDSLSRARAAAKARSKKWEARQLRHARATARKLAAHLDAQARRREQTARSLGGQARETTTIEISNPAGWARLLRKLGLPDPITDGLNRLGLRPGPFRRLFVKPPAGQLTVPSLADAVADPAGVARDLALAEDLRSFAAGPY